MISEALLLQQVERAAREWFFFLDCSIPFDTHTFGSYRPIRNNLEVTLYKLFIVHILAVIL
jgi:hypothetical protein